MIGHDHLTENSVCSNARCAAATSTSTAHRRLGRPFDTRTSRSASRPQPWDPDHHARAPWPRERIRAWSATETAFPPPRAWAGVPILAICFGAQLLAEALSGDHHSVDHASAGTTSTRPVGSGIPTGPWFCWNAEQIVPPTTPSCWPRATTAARPTDSAASVSSSIQMNSHLLLAQPRRPGQPQHRRPPRSISHDTNSARLRPSDGSSGRLQRLRPQEHRPGIELP
ncbi:hypothetical protein HBB16_09975 [Pseudonocardia sp. MCCB 268]|nr:hypothetical protein [Pseudonocardia cytotoxica]